MVRCAAAISFTHIITPPNYRFPLQLVNQLSPGGRLLCPVGPEGGNQSLVQVDKDLNGRTTTKELMGVMYIPLTDLHRQTQR